MNYFEAMDFIKSKYKFGSNYGLKRMETVLVKLGNPEKNAKAIHIAGTNGKGSVASGISKILEESGYRVGLYISPFIEVFEERISINGENISKEDLALYMSKIKGSIEEAERDLGESLTEFEVITILMFLYFSEKNVDYAVLETGLGGRLDATNVVEPILSAITSISFDHMEILGDTLAKIAFEKAGIIKQNVPVVLFPQEEEAYEMIKHCAKEKNSKLYYFDKTCVKSSTSYKNKPYQDIVIETKRDIYSVRFSLIGEHQKYNCAMIIHICEALMDLGINLKKDTIYRALLKVVWIGRLEIIHENPLVVLDGAHNDDGMRNLVKSIDEYFSFERLFLVFGMLKDKNIEVKEVLSRAHKVFTTEINIQRTLKADELYKRCREVKVLVNCENDPIVAILKAVKEANKEDMILVCGSLYLIGEVRGEIMKKLKEL
ncbi:MAG: bifunctional folylpolyglutamate synthase/dihydrofolate synthase [Oscillospiraceae bacterium]|nr:bifunctional folylpolyglutamate synthase/dihydrofolate synthase [Oscillospiraceae bacterium]